MLICGHGSSKASNLSKSHPTPPRPMASYGGTRCPGQGSRRNRCRTRTSRTGGAARSDRSGRRTLIVLHNCSVSTHQGRFLLSDIAVTLPTGSVTLVQGPHKSGKSLLTQLIAGRLDSRLVKQGGIIQLGDVKPCRARARRAEVRYVPQHCRAHKARAWSEGRVEALRRATSGQPAFLVADEPTSLMTIRVHANWMRELWEATRRGCTALIATCQPERYAVWADHLFEAHDGRLHPPVAQSAESASTPHAPSAHISQLKQVVRSRLNLDEFAEVVIRQSCTSEIAPILTTVRTEDESTWIFPMAVSELSPHRMATELHTFPKGHTYAFDLS
jgi:ABC-type cobalamin/Fe3+-siderophores transport system ATPase subunit